MSVRVKNIYKITVLLLASYTLSLSAQQLNQDSIPVKPGTTVKRAIYSEKMKMHGDFYNELWGMHYRPLYYEPVSVKAASLESLFGGLSIERQIPKMHGLVLNNEDNKLYFLRPLGGASGFMESGFFRHIYHPEDFKDTYLGDFVSEAYTIAHPYTFIASGQMADKLGLLSFNPRVVYISQTSESDTIADGSSLKNKMVAIAEIPDINKYEYVSSTAQLVDTLHINHAYTVNQEKYIRTRLFDILIGDWNKIPESWNWLGVRHNDTIVYEPVVVDRNYGFTKVDGKFFKPLLKMLGVSFITSYEPKIKNVRKMNELGYALDIALTHSTNEELWISEAKYIQGVLSDGVIDEAFSRLPSEMQGAHIDQIKNNLKERRNSLVGTAQEYYRILQKTPVITGTDSTDRFVIEDDENQDLRIKLYDQDANNLLWDKKFSSRNTKEIWIYSFGGNDTFEINKQYNPIRLMVIGGKGENNYLVQHSKKTSIYESASQKERLKSVDNIKKIYPEEEKETFEYNYENLRHTEWSFTPIGIYDSDLGLNIGTSVAYTIYGFGRRPYSSRHQFSFDYVNGFTYQGIFPGYDSKRSFHLSAYVGSPAYFSNFFGFGNSTSGYKDESKKYNRVNINKYAISPAFYYNIDDSQEFNVTSSLELIKVGNPKGRDRFINTVYDDDNSIFDANYYADLSATYKLDKKTPHFISKYKIEASAGWNINIAHPGTNFPYLAASVGADFKIIDRLTFATLVKGKTLLTDKYEFFQSATTELRGFRDNRFIGKSSFYQYSDIRWDMGRLDNPFTPLLYGVFVGIDYGRVWYPGEDSDKWHTSYGGGFWLTLFRDFTGKFSYFASNDTGRFTFTLGLGF